jgi:hypothetical protein
MTSKIELEILVRESFVNGRVCPIPKKWNELYKLITSKTNANDLPLPFILNSWWDSTNVMKEMRLKEHLEYAYDNGLIKEVKDFLSKLNESEWHHLKD